MDHFQAIKARLPMEQSWEDGREFPYCSLWKKKERSSGSLFTAPVEVGQILFSTSVPPSKQNVIRHPPSNSNFWKPHHSHSWFMKTFDSDHCTWTWVWPRQSLHVGIITSILSSAKISQDHPSSVVVDLGYPVTSQWAFKDHSVWSCSELRGPCARQSGP